MSRSLIHVESTYGTFGWDFLFIYLAVEVFRHFLAGQDFTVFSTQKPLSSPSNKLSTSSTPGDMPTRLYLEVHFRHPQIHGSGNRLTEAQFKTFIAHLQLIPGIDLAEVAAEQCRIYYPFDEAAS
ncbi:unnamed protein product [Schistocephalus solidus]|uniref:Transposase n=1 Tax=Schistocephalus solidus TaxID=70667 RepID=A0A183SFB3_SCHSO|nr:unnamed protein product [Schistocephalus solidus]